MLESIFSNSWLASGVILISQLIFIYLRTVNIIYTAEKRILPAVLSGMGVSISWLISISIGLNSIMTGAWQPIITFLIGGAMGTYWGIIKEKKRDGRKD
jgi:uncharacterized protein YebE (UPF0316 family)